MTRAVAPTEVAFGEEVASVMVVLELLRGRTPGANVVVDVTPAWRFSGRSWGLTPGRR